MKKFSTFLIVAAMTFAFAACGGDKKTEGEATQDNQEVADEQKEEVKEDASQNSIDKYVSLIDRVAELSAKVKEGDAAATEEVTKIMGEIATLAQDAGFQAESAKEENIQKLQDAAKKLLESQGAN